MDGYYEIDIKELQKNKSKVREPFEHQQKAFKNMSKLFTFPINGYKGSLLVLPTGGGKTFTSINWICRNVVSKNIKVLWLAPSLYLLEQAEKTFREELISTYNRDIVNMRVVSSSSSHCNSGSIKLSDDILICTTQSAIKAYNTEHLLDANGQQAKTPFRKFIDNVSDSELFIVVDEAHHAPAYGCRNLLLSLRDHIKNLYILGLTATPVHNDERISGWLWEIFNTGIDRDGICYEADKTLLESQNILTPPKFIEKNTNMEFQVDDKVYKNLTLKHKDLPENIIDELASKQGRNDLIVSDYLDNKDEYGKTLIFADRWYQCEYIVEQLKKNGIRANSVYSKIAKGLNKGDSSGRRNNESNEKVLRDFRNNKYDVIVNVKMLTEGVDVPDVKTIMVTRQTTSPILFTQMVGRALRGKLVGGGDKDYANIVLFTDKWRRLMPFVTGKKEDIEPVRRQQHPLNYISVKMVQLACGDIDFHKYSDIDFIEFIPLGWFSLEYSIIQDGGFEEAVTFERVIVYNFNKDKYDKLIDDLLDTDLSEYSDEDISDEEILPFAQQLKEKYFDDDLDNFDDCLEDNIIKIIRHLSQNEYKPEFFDFLERNYYDLDSIADEFQHIIPLNWDKHLIPIYNDESKMWDKIFGNYYYFRNMVSNIVFQKNKPSTSETATDKDTSDEPDLGVTEEQRLQVFQRDHYTCKCCGKRVTKGRSLTVDHIIPISMGGRSSLTNLQTLCSECNSAKERQEINFGIHSSPLDNPKQLNLSLKPSKTEDPKNTLKRIINNMYHCGAVCDIKCHKRKSGKFYYKWLIKLYDGNNTTWLENHKAELLDYIHDTLNNEQVIDLIIE
ncbi:DEAD/DEAH box helicase family protein [Intestinibacter sp.]|uniref:DEAD/DEAH box helicase family protein n=1 Tax=Intestinibacter sp. TaxID=1965304 RepID=UPI002A91C936|nr:DEAD/DEAH box helicase family protein [Intestinibacter sp.]MDY5213044.1 DEAD/DEAH box helicase family protein [Intestinibacter sp.]